VFKYAETRENRHADNHKKICTNLENRTIWLQKLHFISPFSKVCTETTMKNKVKKINSLNHCPNIFLISPEKEKSPSIPLQHNHHQHQGYNT